ncbi:MAG: thymidylate synthase [Gammaproteobacteria bacterium]|nr:MAG: thymidylate synthase [Gammaproteobacteria bacterium]
MPDLSAFQELKYLDLVREILDSGIESNDRTGVGTKSIFGHQMRYDLQEGFPLITTKKINFKHVITELLWILRGDTDTDFLHKHNCKIWDDWSDENGELGPIYGKQWRRWDDTYMIDEYYGQEGSIDQISNLVDSLKSDPNSRRHLVTAYNPAEIPEKAPIACHTMFQLYARNGKLSLKLYQRSADLMVGVPYNIASYSLLLLMLAQVTGLEAHEFIHTFGDVHIYNNHVEGAVKQLSREPKDPPTVTLNEAVTDIFKFKHSDITLSRYNPHRFIKFPIAV